MGAPGAPGAQLLPLVAALDEGGVRGALRAGRMLEWFLFSALRCDEGFLPEETLGGG